MLYTILAALATAAGLCATLMILVLLMASGANSTEQEIRTLKFWLLGFSIGGLLCLSLGILLTCKAHPIFGGLIGALPGFVLVGGMVWLSLPR